MKSRTKAILSIMAMPPLLMELLSGNLPGSVFIQPLYLIILITGYSLPVLIIRELSVRWKLGLAGIFTLGLAYGIFNEGIGAKTILLNQNVPVPSFDNYGYFLGINFPWAAYIMVFQAMVSVLFPILFVHYLYPDVKQVSWFGKKSTIALAVPSAIAGTIIFFSPVPFQAQPVYFPVFLVSMAVLAIVARFMPKSEGLKNARCGIKPLFLGIAFLALYALGLDLLANMKVELALFYSSMIGILLLFAFILKSKNWLTTPALLLFGIGVYMVLGITGTLSTVIIKGYPEGLITGPAFEIAFIWVALRIRKQQLSKPK